MLVASAVGVCVSLGAETNRAAVYSQDVEFLLRELPARAGHFFEVKGVDWTAVSRQFREDVRGVTNDVEHVRLCERLLARLRDGHASLRDVRVAMPEVSAGRRWSGPGIHLVVADTNVFVRQTYGAAAAKGLRPGVDVATLEGVPARVWLDQRVAALRDDHGYSTPHQALYAACHWGLGGWEGTPLPIEARIEGTRRSLTLTRTGGSNFIPRGPVFPPPRLRRLGRQSYGRTVRDLGYIHLRDVPANLPDQLDIMLAALDGAPGLILDLRANGGGGCDHGAVFGRFVPRGTPWRRHASAGTHPYAGPMVVLVDAGTRSAGETVAAMLKEDGRAWLLGDGPTAGTSSQKTTLAVPSGLFSVYFSVASNMRRSNGGRGIEGLGIPPHAVVSYAAADLLAGVDTLIRAAEDWLLKGLPKDRVPYTPPTLSP